MPRRIKDVLNVLNAAATSSWWRVILAGLLVTALVSQTIAGPRLVVLGGLAATAIAYLTSSPIQFAALGRPGLKALAALGRTRRFWWIIAGSAVSSAGITLPFSMVATKLPLGLLVPLMGAGLLVVTIIENLPGSRGLRRALVIFSPLLTAVGFALFAVLPTSGKSHIHLTDLALAGLAAFSLACFTVVQGKAAKLGKDERDTVPGQLVMALANLVAGILLLAVALLTGGGGHFDLWLMLQIAVWGFLWMAGPTLLNMVARTGLGGLYPALQQLGTPVGMLVQVFVQHKPASAGAWVANLLITLGSALLAIQVDRIASAQRRLDRATRKETKLVARHQISKATDAVKSAKFQARLDRRAAKRKAAELQAYLRSEAARRRVEVAVEAARILAVTEENGNRAVMAATANVTALKQGLATRKATTTTQAAGNPPATP